MEFNYCSTFSAFLSLESTELWSQWIGNRFSCHSSWHTTNRAFIKVHHFGFISSHISKIKTVSTNILVYSQKSDNPYQTWRNSLHFISRERLKSISSSALCSFISSFSSQDVDIRDSLCYWMINCGCRGWTQRTFISSEKSSR